MKRIYEVHKADNGYVLEWQEPSIEKDVIVYDRKGYAIGKRDVERQKTHEEIYKKIGDIGTRMEALGF